MKKVDSIQCYCPNKHYERKELYEKQRDKITEDLGKLKTHEVELKARLGSTKLNHWVFVTPEFDKNNLLAHARTKEVLVRTWSLPFLTDDFTVLLYDGDDYLVEIKKVLSAAGQALSLDLVAPVLATPNGAPEDFERNIDRKCRIRLAPKALTANFEGRIQGLKQLILENFLKSLLFDEPGQHSMAVDSQRALLNQLSSQLTLQSIVAASFDESEDVFRNATRNIDFKLIQWGGKLIRPL